MAKTITATEPSGSHVHPRLQRLRRKFSRRRARKLLGNPLLPLRTLRARIRKRRLDPDAEADALPRRLAPVLDRDGEELAGLLEEIRSDEPFREDFRDRYRELEVLGDLRLLPPRLDCEALYVAIRAAGPDRVVATGSRFGAFDAYLARALERNGRGTLHSIDLPGGPEAFEYGHLVPDWCRHRWQIHEGDVRDILPDLMDDLAPVDAFVHDSLHTKPHMRWEFETAHDRLAADGVLLSHDVLLSDVFPTFARDHGMAWTRTNNVGVASRASPDRTGPDQAGAERARA
jgi:predicted O-methyltransferase YrrM